MAKPAVPQAQRSTTGEQAFVRSGRVMPAVLASLLGIFILYGVGIAQPSVLHNAAHDSRHAISFPCH